MLVDEEDAAPPDFLQRLAGNFVLTNLTAVLSCGSSDNHDDIDSQGNYDYHAHAQVYWGGADPLGSQGYASEVKHPSSS
jgi:hypothetical protein